MTSGKRVQKFHTQISHAAWPIRGSTQIWVVTRHQYGISALVSLTSFGRETSGGVAKCRLFSQARTCFGFWDVFWILGHVLDSGKCFVILRLVLNSGKCFKFWEMFWILGSVLDSGTCCRFWEVFCPYEKRESNVVFGWAGVLGGMKNKLP